MTSRDFCYWLQGYFEIAGEGGGLTVKQADAVRSHLAMVFVHEIDPEADAKTGKGILDHLHKNPPDGVTYRC